MFKDISGYEGQYAVNEEGEILSRARKVEKIVKAYKLTSRKKSVYYRIRLQYKGKSKAHLIHRLVAELFIPNPQELPQVNHKDKNSLNNHISNLEWCTAKENVEHSKGIIRNWIGPSGEIRNCTLTNLAIEFNLSVGNLAGVHQGKRKQHKGWRINEFA